MQSSLLKNRSYLWISAGGLIGLIATFLNFDIHFYLYRNYITAFVAIIIGFSVVWFLSPKRS